MLMIPNVLYHQHCQPNMPRWPLSIRSVAESVGLYVNIVVKKHCAMILRGFGRGREWPMGFQQKIRLAKGKHPGPAVNFGFTSEEVMQEKQQKSLFINSGECPGALSLEETSSRGEQLY
ncbi:hypothetical protein CDAR_489791 [Caerostris darwini]|uniref:Uncharacterized protein n=1 Tax=Caerostris darwini TaxID=1538125 RepID=A0AAV4STA7_9ARAC|nr:hypothetical protein CDAR_489791 [Caerostris darwini]